MEIVEKLIKKSLQELQRIGFENGITNGNQESRLIFPKYCVGEHAKEGKNNRISEQEARFLFIRELENKKNEHCFYYSIETPTKLPYRFSDKINKEFKPQIVPVKDGGQSASVDVTLYEKVKEQFCRKHLIEFKFGNVKTCKKDFLKLLCDDNQCKINYFINILENCGHDTIESIHNKYKDSIQYISNNYQICSELRCFVFIYGSNNDEDLKFSNDSGKSDYFNFLVYRYLDNKFDEIKSKRKRI